MERSSRGSPRVAGAGRGPVRVAVDLGAARTKVAVSAGTVFGFMSERTVPGDAGDSGGGHPQVNGDFLGALLIDGDGSVQSAFGTIDSLVLAVPDAWYEPEVGGVWARERLWRVVHEQLGMPLFGFVGQSVAAAAFLAQAPTSHEQPAGPMTILVCDVGASTVSAALCELAGPSVRLLDVQIREIRDGAATGSAFERDVLRAAMTQLGQPVPDHTTSRYARLVQSLDDALVRQHRRAWIALDRAQQQARYRQTPVFEVGAPVAPAWITAGEVIGCFAPVAEGLAATIAVLDERHGPVLAKIQKLALTGGLGAFPLARDAAVRALEATARRQPPEVSVLDAHAIARGALAVSEGLVDAVDRQAYAVSLPVHRIVAGRLVGERMSLVDAGEAALPEVTHNGEPFVVEVIGGPYVPALHVDIARKGGRWKHASIAPDRPVPPGRYRVSVWPTRDGPGGLALRPVDGAQSQVYALSEPADRPAEGTP